MCMYVTGCILNGTSQRLESWHAVEEFSGDGLGLGPFALMLCDAAQALGG